jgi:uncharacterized membrane protein required for colicin V production
MNWFDVGLFFLIVGSVVSGIRQGFSRTGFGLLAVIAAFLSAAWLYPTNLKAFIVVFIGLLCAAALLAFLLGRWFKTAGVRPLDAVLGGAVGLTNALLLSTAAVLVLMAFAPKVARTYVTRSNFAPYAVEAARAVAQVIPDEMKFRVEDSYAELMQVLPPKFRKPIPRIPRNES